MIRIDLRYVMPVVALYAPTILFAGLGFMRGFSLHEMREVLLAFGGLLGILGIFAALATVALYSVEHEEPVWFYIKGGEAMTYFISLLLFLMVYATVEFLSGFFDLDSTHVIASAALFLACWCYIRINGLEGRP